MYMSKNKKNKLPNKMLLIKSSDKEFHEKWHRNRNMLNFPHPCRYVIFGTPNSGKTLTIKNILLRAEPPYERIMVLHADPEAKEYEDIEAEVVQEIPHFSDWDGLQKTAFIIDDSEISNLSKEQKINLDRLCGYCSTHKNISVFISTQDLFSIPIIARKCSNVIFAWRVLDLDQLNTIGRRCGLKKGELLFLFDKLGARQHDSICIDLTTGSPFPFRYNGFTPIDTDGNKLDASEIRKKHFEDK